MISNKQRTWKDLSLNFWSSWLLKKWAADTFRYGCQSTKPFIYVDLNLKKLFIHIGLVRHVSFPWSVLLARKSTLYTLLSKTVYYCPLMYITNHYCAVHYCLFLSITIHYRLQLSINVHYYPVLSIAIHHYPLLTITVNIHYYQ